MAARNAKANRAALGSQRGRDPFVKERVVGKTFGFPYMIFFLLLAFSFFIQKERKCHVLRWPSKASGQNALRLAPEIFIDFYKGM